MTVDPKYADLPWIAHDGTDVYETEDLPEVDQNSWKNNEETSIETIVINLDNAKKVFGCSNINADDVDFSDRIQPFVNTGYVIERNEYAMYPPSEQSNESVLDRFQRIQHEVRDFVNEIEQIKTCLDENVDNQSKNIELIDVEKNIEELVNCLSSYKTHCSLGAEESVNVEIDEDLCGFETREMFEKIQTYIAKHKKDNSNQEKLIWEKFYKSPLNKEMNCAKIASIEQRIQRLEAAIGYGERCSNLSNLNTETATKCLLESVKILTSRCQPLKGGPNVDKIELRLVALQSKLQSITEKRDLITEADRQNKIAELFTLYQKWQQFQLVLPVLVKRLEDLQELHNQAMQFAESINFIDRNQKEMKKDLKQFNDIIIQNFASEHNINVIQWPPRSPDLNIVESIWKMLSDHIYIGNQFSNINELQAVIRNSIHYFNETRRADIIRLYENFRHRLTHVLRNHGNLFNKV